MSNEINTPKTFATLTGKDKRIETEIHITDEHLLTITTSRKSWGGGVLSTKVMVSRRIKSIPEPFLYGFLLAHDYSRDLVVTHRRITANAIKSQHDEALSHLEDIVTNAKKHYRIGEVAGGVVVA